MIAAALAIVPSIMGWYRAKQEAQMKLYEIAWEATCNIAKFIWNNFWLVVKVIALLWVLWQWYGAVNDRDAANKLVAKTQAEYASHLKDDAAANVDRIAEIKAKDQQGAAINVWLVAQHKKDEAQIILNSQKKEAKYEADKKLSDSMLAAARDGLQLAVQRQAASASARLSGDGERQFTQEHTNAALLGLLKQTESELATCQEAGAFCAADYNYCYGYVKGQQSIIGVKND
jgi:hypothetical protein